MKKDTPTRPRSEDFTRISSSVKWMICESNHNVSLKKKMIQKKTNFLHNSSAVIEWRALSGDQMSTPNKLCLSARLSQ